VVLKGQGYQKRTSSARLAKLLRALGKENKSWGRGEGAEARRGSDDSDFTWQDPNGGPPWRAEGSSSIIAELYSALGRGKKRGNS